MCGRFANSEDPEIQAAYFLAKAAAVGWRPTWNAAPTQELPVLMQTATGRELVLMRWGWQRSFERTQLLVNARGEEAAGKRTWQEALARRRCIVPATAFYEWSEATNQPYAFQQAQGGLFGIGALWEPSADGNRFVLLTTIANAVVRPVHHRMAHILPQAQLTAWLDPATPPALVAQLIAPYPAGLMRSFPVSRAVNAVAHDAPELLTPVSLPTQQSLFE